MISNEITEKFFKALDEMEKQGSEFLCTDISSCDFSLELKYPRRDFIEDVNRVLNKYDIAQKTDITSFFGFAIEQGPLYLTLRGCPVIVGVKISCINNKLGAGLCIYIFVKRQKLCYIRFYTGVSFFGDSYYIKPFVVGNFNIFCPSAYNRTGSRSEYNCSTNQKHHGYYFFHLKLQRLYVFYLFKYKYSYQYGNRLD